MAGDYGPGLSERLRDMHDLPDGGDSYDGVNLDYFNMPLLAKRIGDHELPLPLMQTSGSAGMDLHYAGLYCALSPGERVLLPAGFAIEVPEGCYGQVAPRSGMALKLGVDVLGGIIDSDYRGEVKVILVNHGTDRVSFRRGDRIAQLLLLPVLTSQFRVVEVDRLDATDRGDGGFGSTGS